MKIQRIKLPANSYLEQRKIMANRLLALVTLCLSLTAFASPCVTESCFIKHTNGDTLYLTDSEISPQDLPTLTNYLNQHNDITHIHLNYTTYCTGEPASCWKKIGDAGAIALAQAKYLIDVDLSFSDITDKGAMALAKNSRLQRLQLSSNQKLTDKGVAALAKLPALTELTLDFTLIGDESIKALATSQTLRMLSVVGYHPAGNLNPASAVALAKNTSITHLNLSRQGLGESGAIALASKPNLVSLDISDNKIRDPGANAFAKHPTLTNLNIGVNKLTAVSAIALAKNTSLKSLNIEVNGIGDEGAIALARHPTIEYLQLSSNYVADRGAIALAANDHLKTLDIRYNKIGEAGIQALSNGKIKQVYIRPQG